MGIRKHIDKDLLAIIDKHKWFHTGSSSWFSISSKIPKDIDICVYIKSSIKTEIFCDKLEAIGMKFCIPYDSKERKGRFRWGGRTEMRIRAKDKKTDIFIVDLKTFKTIALTTKTIKEAIKDSPMLKKCMEDKITRIAIFESIAKHYWEKE